MRGGGRIYITYQGCDNYSKAIEVMHKISVELDKMAKSNQISAYFLRVLYDEKSVIDEMLEPKEIAVVANDHLPVIYVNVSYELDTDFMVGLSKLTQDYQLHLIRSRIIK